LALIADQPKGARMNRNARYRAKEFRLSGFNGISDLTLEMHFQLYEGYVKETNRLTTKIAEFLKNLKQINSPKRRFSV
jgi:hypothetical protein